MKLPNLLPSIFLFCFLPWANAQNYLRVSDPDSWGAPTSNQTGWYDYYDHGKFEEVRIVATPKGVFTEMEVYATITHSPNVSWWGDDFEIVWQFELPPNAIVHDAWLWVGADIIKADVVDFWTALETYTGIVDYNQDPLFFYQLSDKRYEVRVYPLAYQDTRRLKLSFLIPADWGVESIRQNLLMPMFKSTDYPSAVIEVAVPVDSIWGIPVVRSGNNNYTMNNTIIGGAGDPLHYIEIDFDDFLVANQLELAFEAPFSTDQQVFANTFSDAGENFYQLVFVPDWENIIQSGNTRKSLILLDFDPSNSSLDITELQTQLQSTLADHFTSVDVINIAVHSATGTYFLNTDWWNFDEQALPGALSDVLQAMEGSDLETLLSDGFNWVQTQGDATAIYLLAANEDYLYPPMAQEIFDNISDDIPASVPLTLLNFQNENVSVIFYDNESYQGNEYFYQLLQNGFDQANQVVLLGSGENFPTVCSQAFPPFVMPQGTVDFTTNLQNGINYEEYAIGSNGVSVSEPGVVMQVGKYVGDFPMNIQAGLVADNGQFWSTQTTVSLDNALPGDSLLRESWYGPYLKQLQSNISSDEDRTFIIQTSIQERVLSELTAFLALEPSLGGEPCIDCLFNNGGELTINVEAFDLAKANLLVTPNPASYLATIQLVYPDALSPSEWTATVHDPSGKMVAELGEPVAYNGYLQWDWLIGSRAPGLYFVKVAGERGELVGKLIVLK